MFICPICGKEFTIDKDVAKHSLKCWKEKNPNHRSKDAPRSADINTREVNSDIETFLSGFRREN